MEYKVKATQSKEEPGKVNLREDGQLPVLMNGIRIEATNYATRLCKRIQGIEVDITVRL